MDGFTNLKKGTTLKDLGLTESILVYVLKIGQKNFLALLENSLTTQLMTFVSRIQKRIVQKI